MRPATLIAVSCLTLFGSLILFGCKQDETPNAEVKSAVKSEQQAKDAQAETAKRLQEGNAVLDGK